jgi:hypothetical protein
VSTATAALLAVGWLAAIVLARRLPTLDAIAPAGGPASTTTSVVIPARDEERNLPRLLRSLEAQQRHPSEVIVVDDGSTDATATVAEALGARVVRAPEPPAGWAGKPWACHLGAEQAGGGLLVLLDADTFLAPDALARLEAAHTALAPGGLLSVQPHHLAVRPHEQLSLVANVVAVLAAGIGLAPSTRAPVAFGPCLVTTADALRAAGGFGAVRGEVLEDVALARAYAAHGRPVRCLLGGRTVGFRMYPDGLRSLVEGWTKNLAGGARRAPPAAAIGAAVWVSALVALVVEAVLRPGPVVAVAWVLFTAQLAWLAARVGTFRWWAIVAFPLPLAAFVGLFVRSLVVRGVRRRVRWRGRDLPVGGG